LPQSRESAGGAAVALLSKAPLQQQQQTQQQMSASGVRGIYSSRVASHAGGLPPGGGVPGNQSHAVHNGSSSSSSQNPQQHARQVKGDTQSGTSVRGISSSGHVLQPLAVRPQAAVLTGGLLQQQSATPRMHSRGGAAAAAGAHTGKLCSCSAVIVCPAATPGHVMLGMLCTVGFCVLAASQQCRSYVRQQTVFMVPSMH
jgi:hypothetical protein